LRDPTTKRRFATQRLKALSIWLIALPKKNPARAWQKRRAGGNSGRKEEALRETRWPCTSDGRHR
jgi:hypothetical protein